MARFVNIPENPIIDPSYKLPETMFQELTYQRAKAEEAEADMDALDDKLIDIEATSPLDKAILEQEKQHYYNEIDKLSTQGVNSPAELARGIKKLSRHLNKNLSDGNLNIIMKNTASYKADQEALAEAKKNNDKWSDYWNDTFGSGAVDKAYMNYGQADLIDGKLPERKSDGVYSAVDREEVTDKIFSDLKANLISNEYVDEQTGMLIDPSYEGIVIPRIYETARSAVTDGLVGDKLLRELQYEIQQDAADYGWQAVTEEAIDTYARNTARPDTDIDAYKQQIAARAKTPEDVLNLGMELALTNAVGSMGSRFAYTKEQQNISDGLDLNQVSYNNLMKRDMSAFKYDIQGQNAILDYNPVHDMTEAEKFTTVTAPTVINDLSTNNDPQTIQDFINAAEENNIQFDGIETVKPVMTQEEIDTVQKKYAQVLANRHPELAELAEDDTIESARELISIYSDAVKDFSVQENVVYEFPQAISENLEDLFFKGTPNIGGRKIRMVDNKTGELVVIQDEEALKEQLGYTESNDGDGKAWEKAHNTARVIGIMPTGPMAGGYLVAIKGRDDNNTTKHIVMSPGDQQQQLFSTSAKISEEMRKLKRTTFSVNGETYLINPVIDKNTRKFKSKLYKIQPGSDPLEINFGNLVDQEVIDWVNAPFYQTLIKTTKAKAN